MHRRLVAMRYERAGDSIDSPNLVLYIIGNQQIPLTIEDDPVSGSSVWQAGPSDSVAPTIYFSDRLLLSKVHRIDIALSIACRSLDPFGEGMIEGHRFGKVKLLLKVRIEDLPSELSLVGSLHGLVS